MFLSLLGLIMFSATANAWQCDQEFGRDVIALCTAQEDLYPGQQSYDFKIFRDSPEHLTFQEDWCGKPVGHVQASVSGRTLNLKAYTTNNGQNGCASGDGSRSVALSQFGQKGCAIASSYSIWILSVCCEYRCF